MTKRSKKRMKQKKQTWNDMSPGGKTLASVVGVAQIVLATSAWRDLAKRSAAQVNGPKGLWAAIIAINWVGPIAYFVKGRRSNT